MIRSAPCAESSSVFSCSSERGRDPELGALARDPADALDRDASGLFVAIVFGPWNEPELRCALLLRQRAVEADADQRRPEARRDVDLSSTCVEML